MFGEINRAVNALFICMFTYKPWAVVTEGGFHVSGLLEVVNKSKTQFGADDTCPHEVSCDLLSAHEAFPEQPQIIKQSINWSASWATNEL